MKQENLPTTENRTFIKSSFASFWDGVRTIIRKVDKGLPELTEQIVRKVFALACQDSLSIKFILMSFCSVIEKLGL